MSHCFVHGCDHQLAGGYAEATTVPGAIIGTRTGWCKEHELQGREHVALFAKPGRFLSASEVDLT